MRNIYRIQNLYYKGINGEKMGLRFLLFGFFKLKKYGNILALMGLVWLMLGNVSFADDPSPFNDKNSNPTIPLNPSNANKDEMTLEEFEDEQTAQEAQKIQFLNAIQNSFFSKKRSPQDNNLNIIYKAGNTPKVRLRYAMTTTFIFDKDTIAYISVGDSSFFEVLAPKKEGYNLSNILIIKPLLIGVDTNLTVIGESGKIYTFYLFSTHFTNSRNPVLSVFISDNRKIGKIDIIPTEVKQAEKLKKLQKLEEINKELVQNNPNANFNMREDSKKVSTDEKAKDLKDDEKAVDYSSKEIDDGKFIRIGDETNHLFIDKSKIKKHYYQAPRKKRMWWGLWLYKKTYPQAEDLKAIDVFDDGKYTYFKYDREKALSKFPYAYKVVDGYDHPINSRVVGNYIIAEDVARKWTLRLGDEYVCVQKIPSKKELDEERLQKAQELVIPISDSDKKEKVNLTKFTKYNLKTKEK